MSLHIVAADLQSILTVISNMVRFAIGETINLKRAKIGNWGEGQIRVTWYVYPYLPTERFAKLVNDHDLSLLSDRQVLTQNNLSQVYRPFTVRYCHKYTYI